MNPTTATRLCASAELAEGQPLRVGVGDEQLILLRHQGICRAFRNSCPHLGIELDWQPGRFLDHSGNYLQCAMHGARFQLQNGLCIAGPCQGQALTAVAVEEHADAVWLSPLPVVE